jgi:hypothetical protein
VVIGTECTGELNIPNVSLSGTIYGIVLSLRHMSYAVYIMARCTQDNNYVIKFVSDLQQVGGFLWVLRFPPSIKLTATI